MSHQPLFLKKNDFDHVVVERYPSRLSPDNAGYLLGNDISTLQEDLIACGVTGITIADGDYGTMRVNGVKAFQNAALQVVLATLLTVFLDDNLYKVACVLSGDTKIGTGYKELDKCYKES